MATRMPESFSNKAVEGSVATVVGMRKQS